MIIHYNCTIGSFLLHSFLLIYHPYPPSFHEMIFTLVVIIVSCIKNQAQLLCKPVQCELKSPFDFTLQLKTLEWHIHFKQGKTDRLEVYELYIIPPENLYTHNELSFHV